MDEEQDTITQVQPNQVDAGALLLAEFIRVITRSHLVVWSRTDDADDGSGFSAAIDSGASDLEILVCPSEAGFSAAIAWYDEDDDAIAEMEAAVAAELYAEVEESWRASGSLGHANAKMAIICKGAAPTTRPFHMFHYRCYDSFPSVAAAEKFFHEAVEMYGVDAEHAVIVRAPGDPCPPHEGSDSLPFVLLVKGWQPGGSGSHIVALAELAEKHGGSYAYS
jgi:hypothetical protein